MTCFVQVQQAAYKVCVVISKPINTAHTKSPIHVQYKFVQFELGEEYTPTTFVPLQYLFPYNIYSPTIFVPRITWGPNGVPTLHIMWGPKLIVYPCTPTLFVPQILGD